MPTQERARATRASIVEGAAAVFDEKGYARASLDLIAAEAGVTRGALYFHFKSKTDLANAVIAEQHRIARVAGEEAVAAASTAFEGLVRMSVGLARQLTTEVIVSAGIRLTTDGTARELSARDPYVDWTQAFRQMLGEAIEQGDVRPTVDADQVARFVVSAYTGLQLVSDSLHDRTDLFDRVRDLWVLLLPALIVPERMAANEKLLALVHA
ncbi:ScbR family autoregulator-binding transcription factor [Frondihabitans cladoniiphilus]|uniref:ScbR family autoregulator-binding transcription factor n=1 Tax=Frondihabitans cladoniiphilus TaxID=715785 RepID=A0ABP8W1G0_9MICO